MDLKMKNTHGTSNAAPFLVFAVLVTGAIGGLVLVAPPATSNTAANTAPKSNTSRYETPPDQWHSPPKTVIEQGSGIESADYIIFKGDEGNIYAKSGDSGQIMYESSDFRTVFNDVTSAIGEGGVVYLKPGTYVAENQIHMENASVLGAGSDVTVIKAKEDFLSTQSLATSYGSNKAIKGMTLDANNQTTRCLLIGRGADGITENVLIEDVVFRSSSDRKLLQIVSGVTEDPAINWNTSFITIRNCGFENATTAHDSMSMDFVDHIFFKNNYVRDINQGFHWWNVENVIIQNNKFENMYTYPSISLRGKDIIFKNNFLYNVERLSVRSPAESDFVGKDILVADSVFRGESRLHVRTNDNDIEGVTLRNLTFRDSRYIEFYTTNGATIRDIQIQGLKNNGGKFYVVFYADGGRFEDIAVSDLTSRGSSSYPVQLKDNCFNFKIQDSSFVEGDGVGIYLGSTVSNGIISGNVFKNLGQDTTKPNWERNGIVVDGCENVTISNNLFLDNQPAQTMLTAIWASSPCSNVDVVNNRFGELSKRPFEYPENFNGRLSSNRGPSVYTPTKRGTATITAGSDNVVVSHNLSNLYWDGNLVPNNSDFELTPLDNLAGASVWVSNANASDFTINISKSLGSDVDIAWAMEFHET